MPDTRSQKMQVLHVWIFWNESNIIKHRDLSQFYGVISSRLKFYSVFELCHAIRNYKDILTSDQHWFTYRWTLNQFLSPKKGLDNFINREAALYNYSIKKNTKFEDGQAQEDKAEFYSAIRREVRSRKEAK